MRFAVRRHLNQENWAAARTLPADQLGPFRVSSRCIGIPGWTGGATHPPVRGPARDRLAIAGHRASCGREGASKIRSSRSLAFGLNATTCSEGLPTRTVAPEGQLSRYGKRADDVSAMRSDPALKTSIPASCA